MLRNLQISIIRGYTTKLMPQQNFLRNDYKCLEAWNKQTSSSILNKVNLNDFYNILNQNYVSKGVISAIDVDIYANALKEPIYLGDLKDLLHKLRLSADTQNTLESTHHATIRHYIEYDKLEELISILNEPLNYGLFLDFFTTNILLDKLIVSERYDLAAKVASFVMLQEDFSHDITNALSKYACYKYVLESLDKKDINVTPPKEEPKVIVEEIKIRVKYLRNPYFDDHFDITDLHLLSGKTLALISSTYKDNINNNLKIVGWLFYQKYEKLKSTVDHLNKEPTFKVFHEVLQLLVKKSEELKDNVILKDCLVILKDVPVTETNLEESLKIDIENAINKLHKRDVETQHQLFDTWIKVREEKLEEQAQRLDRVKRIQDIEEKQKTLQVEEQKLWFFENEEQIDLEIEKKEEEEKTVTATKTVNEKSDQDYIPPEILPKRS